MQTDKHIFIFDEDGTDSVQECLCGRVRIYVGSWDEDEAED